MAKSKDQSHKIAPMWFSGWDEIDRAFNTFRKDLEKSFLSFPSLKVPSVPSVTDISCDIIDEGKQFVVKIDVPGVKKNEISLNVDENSIELSAEHKEEAEEKKKNYLRRERKQLSYYRTIPLPEKVVSDKTKAKLADGVLTVTLPKLKPTPAPKKKTISVQ